MATIRNTIALNDRMSPVLKSIVKSLNSTITALSSVDGISEQTFNQAAVDAQNAANAIRDLDNRIEDLEPSIQSAESGFRNWQSFIITANQAIQLVERGVNTVSGYLNKLSDMTDVQSRLKRMAGDQMTIYELQSMIARAADETRTSYEATALSSLSMYNNLSAAGVSQKQAIRLSEIMNKQLAAAGVKGAQLESVIFQLGQSLQSGRIRYEDWKLVQANAGAMAESISRAAGVTKSELNQMVQDGKVSAEQFAKWLWATGSEIDAVYENMPDTFADQMERMRTAAYNKIVGQGGIQETITNALNSNAWNGVLDRTIAVINNFLDWTGNRIQQFIDWVSNDQVQVFLSRVAWGISVLATLIGAGISLGMDFMGVLMLISGALQPIEPLVWGIVASLGAYYLITKSATWALAIYTAVTKGVALAQAGLNTVLAFANVFWMILTGSQCAATAATLAFNGALSVTQILLIGIVLAVIAVIAIVFATIGVINKVTGYTISALGVITGAVFTAGAFIWNLIVGTLNGIIQLVWNIFAVPVISIMEWILNAMDGGFNSFGDAVKNLIGNIISWFLGLGKVVTTIIDAIFGTDWTSGLESLQSSLLSWGKNENAITIDRSAPEVLSRLEYGKAWDSGYGLGENAQNWIGSKFNNVLTGIGEGNEAAEIAANSVAGLEELALGKNGGIKTDGNVTIDDESIKLMKDVASAEWVNKYTTLRPEMTVTFGDVHETADANKLLEVMEEMIAEAYASALTD